MFYPLGSILLGFLLIRAPANAKFFWWLSMPNPHGDRSNRRGTQKIHYETSQTLPSWQQHDLGHLETQIFGIVTVKVRDLCGEKIPSPGGVGAGQPGWGSGSPREERMRLAGLPRTDVSTAYTWRNWDLSVWASQRQSHGNPKGVRELGLLSNYLVYLQGSLFINVTATLHWLFPSL